MNRLPIILLFAALLSAPALSQEADEEALPDEPAMELEPEPEVEAEPDPEFDESGLDEQGFADEDDDFDPTETIPTDQSIEFPTDI